MPYLQRGTHCYVYQEAGEVDLFHYPSKDRWTHRMLSNIPNIMFKFIHNDSPECPNFIGTLEDAVHILVQSLIFNTECTTLQGELQKNVRSEILVESMIQSVKKWQVVMIIQELWILNLSPYFIALDWSGKLKLSTKKLLNYSYIKFTNQEAKKSRNIFWVQIF